MCKPNPLKVRERGRLIAQGVLVPRLVINKNYKSGHENKPKAPFGGKRIVSKKKKLWFMHMGDISWVQGNHTSITLD